MNTNHTDYVPASSKPIIAVNASKYYSRLMPNNVSKNLLSRSRYPDKVPEHKLYAEADADDTVAWT